MDQITTQNILKYNISAEDEGKRVRAILTGKLKFSRTLLRKLKKTENVLLNGKPIYLIDRVKQGDTLEVILDLPEKASIQSENIPLNILYENEDLMVINKPAGLVVHPTKGHQSGTLANAVAYYWQSQGKEKIFRPVQRLDKDTSGAIIIANNHFADQHLSRQIKNKELGRNYLAIVQGILTPTQGKIFAPIAPAPDHGTKRIVHTQGQSAITWYEVEKYYHISKATLVKLKLETGRTHQIRVHMAHLGHPLLGDSLYGGDTELINRQALHAYSTYFLNPKTGEKIHIKCELPKDIKNLLSELS